MDSIPQTDPVQNLYRLLADMAASHTAANQSLLDCVEALAARVYALETQVNRNKTAAANAREFDRAVQARQEGW